MASDELNPDIKVLVTGFGAYRQFKTNPSWQVASQLPASITHRGLNIEIAKPTEAMKSEYGYIIDTIPKLVDSVQPNIVISIGQDESAKDFKIERGARRDAYHQCPDSARGTLTKSETRALWPGCPEQIQTELDVGGLLRRWRGSVPKAKGDNGPGLDLSDDAGDYVCGLLYYTLLAHLRKKGDVTTKAVFLHVPPLKSEAELRTGEAVAVALIRALSEG